MDRHGHIGATRLSGHAVALVLKRHAARAGLDPYEMSGHSLQAGLATSAAAAGVSERVIAEQTGHKGTAMLRRYIREGALFRENAANAVGCRGQRGQAHRRWSSFTGSAAKAVTASGVNLCGQY